MQDNVSLVRSFYADFANLQAAMTPETCWNETAGLHYGGRYVGPEEIFAKVFSHIERDWQGFHAEPTQVLAVGDDRVLSLGRYRGTFKSTGKSIDAEFAHLYQLSDGRLVEFTQYADSATYNAAME